MTKMSLINASDVRYKEVLKLRNEVLRHPLGMDLKDEDLSDEINQFVFILEYENELISCLLLKRINSEILKLRQMAVSPKHQSVGHGARLVKFAEQWALEKDYKEIELHAREVAMGFYERLDFMVVGESFLEVNVPHFKMSKIIQSSQTE